MKAGYSRELSQEAPIDRLRPSATSSQSGLASAEPSHLLQKIESLRSRLSTLSRASLRVSETLDVNTVLKEVIDNARDLTDARYGALLTYERSGSIQDFITSGMSDEQIEHMNTLPKGLGLLGYINEIREPLRISDISSHPSSVGFPENHPPMKTFLGMPIRHSGEHVGNIYLTEKEGGRDFTREDQDVLVMFASQAGAAIFNARRYREEQQAKADLEALVNISPVGVVVFDAETGDLVSANDETRRIVGKLNNPGRSLSQLLEVITLRRPDGTDIPVEELPTTKAVMQGESVLADEVVIHLPDGRAITTLVSARPIRRDDGKIVSVVATIQDITPLEEVKVQRAEFLSNVSHELRTPLSAIKGSASAILSSPHPLDVAETRQFLRVIDEQSDYMRNLINDLVDLTQVETGSIPVNPEVTEVGELLDQAIEARTHAGQSGGSRDVELDLSPDLPSVMADKIRMFQVLDNLLSCVSDLRPESSTPKIRARPSNDFVAFTVDSEGGGPAGVPDLYQMSGTAGREGQFAIGRNRKEDMVIAISKGIIEAHGGRLTIETGPPGSGNRFTFTIPAVAGVAHFEKGGPSNTGIDHDSSGAAARILAVTDDPETSRYVRSTLSRAGFTAVDTCISYDADRFIELHNPQVVLLEPTLPWEEGFELLRRVRRSTDAPVVIVAGTGWNQHMGRVFELGVSDYIAKPFTPTELVARTELALRSSRPVPSRELSGPYVYGDLSIDYATRTVTVAGSPVRLTATEYNLLSELSAAAGRVLSHGQLLRRVWGPLYAGDARIVRTYVKDLRQKLGDDARRPMYIFTEPGVGYRMARQSSGRQR